jgi:hypothetical protein
MGRSGAAPWPRGYQPAAGGRKRALGTRASLALPQGPNERWFLDFLHYQLREMTGGFGILDASRLCRAQRPGIATGQVVVCDGGLDCTTDSSALKMAIRLRSTVDDERSAGYRLCISAEARRARGEHLPDHWKIA